MIAFHGKSELKANVLAMLAVHREADTLAKGSYWSRGKGCAVGCTLESIRRIEGLDIDEFEHGNHALYETYLGVPRALARLEDGLFENLPNGTAQAWPERFTNAIRPGADLSMVVPTFLHWLLSDPDGGVQKAVTKYPKSRPSVQAVIDLYARWISESKPSDTEWREARRNAYAAYAAAYADAYAADAADAAAAYADYAAYAAYAAAYAAAAYAAAADAAAYAAYAAAYAADAYAYAADAAAAARSRERIKQADKLIELIEACE